MSISLLKDYNNALLKANEDITIKTYFDYVISNITDIDSAFVKLYLSILDKEDTFMLKDDLLYKYGIITDNSIEAIKELLYTYTAELDIDYIIDYNLNLDLNTNFTITENIFITPKFFKIMLIKSNHINDNPYVEYIYILKRIECYYYKYKFALKEKELQRKQTELISYKKEIRKLNNEIKDLNNNFLTFKSKLVDKLKYLDSLNEEEKNNS